MVDIQWKLSINYYTSVCWLLLFVAMQVESSKKEVCFGGMSSGGGDMG